MEEEEARRNYCRRMISVVRRKQPKCGSSVLGRRERENQTTSVRTSAECRMRTGEGESSNAAVVSGIRRTPFRTESRPEAQPVPAQLVTMLRLKTAQEKISRVIIIIIIHQLNYLFCIGRKPNDIHSRHARSPFGNL